MTLFFAVILGIIGYCPLIILVLRADKIRVEMMALALAHENGLMTPQELAQKKQELMNRPPRNALDPA